MENQISNLKSFSVYGLSGTDDVHIPFDENIKILVGENGIGKTQVLNLFYYTLTRNFFRLGEFSFDRLVLEFYDKKNVEISKYHIYELIKQVYENPLIIYGFNQQSQIQYLQLKYPDSLIGYDNLKNKFIKNKIDLLYTSDESKITSEIKNKSDFIINKIGKNKVYIFNTFFYQCEKEIKSATETTDIMYFPTYRRVEEDLYNLGYDDYENYHILNQENTLIQFGMDDVQKSFNQIESTIDKLLKEGFSKITSEILKEYLAQVTS